MKLENIRRFLDKGYRLKVYGVYTIWVNLYDVDDDDLIEQASSEKSILHALKKLNKLLKHIRTDR